VIRRHAYELFTRQDAKKLLDRVAVDNPKVVEDLVPKTLPLAIVQRVLQNLLRERVSIRDAVSILEVIRRTVAKPYLSATGDLSAYFVEASIEQAVEAAVEHAENNSHCALAPKQVREILSKCSRTIGNPEAPVVAITSSASRYFLRQLVEPVVWNLFFLSHNEVPAGIKVHSLGVIQ
jgi:flagellar biosynthesis protein FlhA